MKKMNNKGFSLVELIVVVAIMAVLMAVLVPTLIRNVEKTRVQKDKSAIAEVHHAVELALADEEFYEASASSEGATASEGAITVAELFGEGDASEALAEEVAVTVGKTVKLTSKMKTDCNVKIVNLDPAAGEVIFEVTSDNADEEFYIDASGENDGTWPGDEGGDDDGDDDDGDDA